MSKFDYRDIGVALAFITYAIMLSIAYVTGERWPLYVLLAYLVLGIHGWWTDMKWRMNNPRIASEEQSNPRIASEEETNPRIARLNPIALLEENEQLKARLAQSGITLPGWWCLHCNTFNGEGVQKHTICRHCEKNKPV